VREMRSSHRCAIFGEAELHRQTARARHAADRVEPAASRRCATLRSSASPRQVSICGETSSRSLSWDLQRSRPEDSIVSSASSRRVSTCNGPPSNLAHAEKRSRRSRTIAMMSGKTSRRLRRLWRSSLAEEVAERSRIDRSMLERFYASSRAARPSRQSSASAGRCIPLRSFSNGLRNSCRADVRRRNLRCFSAGVGGR